MFVVENPTVTVKCRTAIKVLFLYFNLYEGEVGWSHYVHLHPYPFLLIYLNDLGFVMSSSDFHLWPSLGNTCIVQHRCIMDTYFHIFFQTFYKKRFVQETSVPSSFIMC